MPLSVQVRDSHRTICIKGKTSGGPRGEVTGAVPGGWVQGYLLLRLREAERSREGVVTRGDLEVATLRQDRLAQWYFDARAAKCALHA